jgi:acetoacetyl-CoA synthetase
MDANHKQANGKNGTSLSNGHHKGAKLLWQHPSPRSTSMFQFLDSVNQKYGLQLSSYAELHKWSIDHIDKFWGRVWHFVGVKATTKASRVSVGKNNEYNGD